MSTTLQRTTFETSRLLEFFSEKELQMQIGFARGHWPMALLKELIDNALDACETAGVFPDIEVTVEPDAVSVRDNGPGLPAATLERSLDYTVRVSDKAYYVSPTRGQLGNALKCLWAAPYVACGEQGAVEVTTGGLTHRIAVRLDRIAQHPALQHLTSLDGFVKTGTLIKVTWPGIAGCLNPAEDSGFYNTLGGLIQSYGAFNPQATLTHHVAGLPRAFPRTSHDWQKWLPGQPTSPHWYTVERLRGLVAAYLAEERRGGRAFTVRAFVEQFHGLSGSVKPKRVTEAAGLSRAYLHDLVADNDVALEPVTTLLAAMQAESRPVKPAALGVLGEAHVRSFLTTNADVEPESITYSKAVGEADGLPCVLEVACGWYTAAYADCRQRTLVGVNWTPALKMPFPELSQFLGECRVDSFDPVVVFVHLAIPRVEYTDRGKSSMAMPVALRSTLAKGVMAVTKHWKVLKKQSDRDDRVRARAREHYLKQQQRQLPSIKEAAYQVMEAAYRQAAGALGMANARQVMYAARPSVLDLTGGKCWKKSNYFTQHLLPDFMEDHPALTADWDVVFDDRGHFVEPHTAHRIGLGTLGVRGYLQRWQVQVPDHADAIVEIERACPTMGPANRYRYALFIEKEGFYPLLEAAQIADRYDMAIMSTKGMSVTAARMLVERLSAQGVTILVCHDFDKSGFSIVHTLYTDTRRYQFRTRPKVIDLGLRLADVQAMDLQSEPVDYDSHVDPRINLRQCGATEAECNVLVRRAPLGGWTGARVELNAMTSDQFIAWLEANFADVGVAKVVPDEETLTRAYRRAVQQRRVQQAINQALADLDEDDELPVPGALGVRLRERLTGSSRAWDEVLWDLAGEGAGEEVAG